MSFLIDESVYDEAPTLLYRGEQGFFFCSRKESGWTWQEQAVRKRERDGVEVGIGDGNGDGAKTGDGAEVGNGVGEGEAGVEAQWMEARPLPRSGDKVCAALDATGRPHLILVENGSFYHLVYREGQFTEELIYKEESKLCHQFQLAGDAAGALHLIYLATDSSAARWWLLHHRYAEKGWEEPRVIDFGGGDSLNYGSTVPDRSGNLHLAYRIVEHDQVGLYYRCFSKSSSNWSKAVPLAAGEEISFPAIAVDDSQNVHVIWTMRSGMHYQVYYRLMTRGGWPSGGWKQEVAVSPPASEKPFPYFTFLQGKLAMAWFDGANVNQIKQEKGNWLRTTARRLEEPLLLRCISFRPLNAPAHYWIIREGGIREGGESGAASEPFGLEEAANAGTGMAGLDFDLEQLQRYSRTLLNRTADLALAKNRLEGALEDKRKELAWLSQESQRKLRSLQQNLVEKDKELQQLEQKFKETIDNLKRKSAEAGKTWEEERKRTRLELQRYKTERRQFEVKLKEQEFTIARLEAQLQEQERRIKFLAEANKELEKKLEESRWNLKKFIARILRNKS